jgi:hypothetical protein
VHLPPSAKRVDGGTAATAVLDFRRPQNASTAGPGDPT